MRPRVDGDNAWKSAKVKRNEVLKNPTLQMKNEMIHDLSKMCNKIHFI